MVNKVDYLRPQEREDIVVFLRKAEALQAERTHLLCVGA